MIFIYVFMSWVPNARQSFIGELLAKFVEPYLSVFRRFIPPLGGMLDLSPIIALFSLRLIALGLMGIVEFLFNSFAG